MRRPKLFIAKMLGWLFIVAFALVLAFLLVGLVSCKQEECKICTQTERSSNSKDFNYPKITVWENCSADTNTGKIFSRKDRNFTITTQTECR